MISVDGRKRCPTCGEEKLAAEQFYVSKASADGFSSACKGCMNARNVEWKKRNRERARAIRAIRGRPGEPRDPDRISIDDWLAVIAAFENRCCYCGAAGDLCLDHLTAVGRGGRTVLGNVAPACERCNRRKHALNAEEFRPDRAGEVRRIASLGRLTEPKPTAARTSPLGPNRAVMRFLYGVVEENYGRRRFLNDGEILADPLAVSLVFGTDEPVGRRRRLIRPRPQLLALRNRRGAATD